MKIRTVRPPCSPMESRTLSAIASAFVDNPEVEAVMTVQIIQIPFACPLTAAHSRSQPLTAAHSRSQPHMSGLYLRRLHLWRSVALLPSTHDGEGSRTTSQPAACSPSCLVRPGSEEDPVASSTALIRCLPKR
jgi:hypothetical protein